jgi:hypothetical protein
LINITSKHKNRGKKRGQERCGDVDVHVRKEEKKSETKKNAIHLVRRDKKEKKKKGQKPEEIKQTREREKESQKNAACKNQSMLLYLYKNKRIPVVYPRARLFGTRREEESTVLAGHSRAIFADANKKKKKERKEGQTKKTDEPSV